MLKEGEFANEEQQAAMEQDFIQPLSASLLVNQILQHTE